MDWDPESALVGMEETIWARFEPLVLHVACRSLPEACQLVAQAQLAFPKSSLLSFRKRFVVQILGEDYVEPWPFSREVVG
eukprot:g23516.t1